MVAVENSHAAGPLHVLVVANCAVVAVLLVAVVPDSHGGDVLGLMEVGIVVELRYQLSNCRLDALPAAVRSDCGYDASEETRPSKHHDA